jgi:hypothetical protein
LNKLIELLKVSLSIIFLMLLDAIHLGLLLVHEPQAAEFLGVVDQTKVIDVHFILGNE